MLTSHERATALLLVASIVNVADLTPAEIADTAIPLSTSADGTRWQRYAHKVIAHIAGMLPSEVTNVPR